MRSRLIAPILLLAIVVYGGCAFLLLIRSSTTSVHYTERRWAIYNGFCIRPYLHAGRDVTLRLLSNPTDPNDVLLTELPRDDPSVFEDDLTLLTHSSASALDEKYLVELLANWRGPISLAVALQGRFNEEFVREKIDKTLQSLKNPHDASQLSVHIMFEKFGKLSCDQSERQLGAESSEDTAFFASYPINTVRNVARLFSTSTYVAFADADYLFSVGFYEHILATLRTNVDIGSKNALLYRIFEVDQEESQLKNHHLTKTDLKGLISTDKARVFHVREWPQGHSMPKLPEWLDAPQLSRPGLFNLTISLKNRLYWEFQFAALRDVPYFDENFPYRADNNLELRWEVCRAGYRLLPVEDLFVYHTLSKDEHDKDDLEKKRAMKRQNYARFLQAKKDLVERMLRLYPNTIDDCPV